MSFLKNIFTRNTKQYLFLHLKQHSFIKNHRQIVNKSIITYKISKTNYLLLFASSYLTYKLIKHQFPTVEAAVPFTGLRQKFNFLADVVEICAPAVVYIEIKDRRRTDFFTGKPITLSNGSGFIIKEDGLILTNAHVVTNKPSAKVEVRLQNGSVYNGVVEHVDTKSDLATVRISARNLPVMRLGNSADLRAGEFVVAMGSPLALSNTVTSGVISSTHRGSDELGLYGKDMVYIQTDAAITFGNSGGPLVNLDGEAIGVNSMKVTAGISFAIPIDYVKQFLEKSKNIPRASDGPKRLYMGITMLTITPQILHELQQRNHLVPSDVQSGILVWKVIMGSPADAGGLQPGDIITDIDGKRITSAKDVYALLSENKSKPLRMSVYRNGRLFAVQVTPEDLSE